MTHRQRVAAWHRRRTVRRRRLAALALTAGWVWAGAPMWVMPAVAGAVFLLVGSTVRGWGEPVPAPDWQDLGPEPSRVHVVRPDLFDRTDDARGAT